MYERPQRRIVTRQEVEQAEFRAALVDAIANDPEVRAAVLRLVTTARAARKPRPTVTPSTRTAGRGR